ncbi:MAG TPA: DegV family protein [Candidatus Egerieimonas intestinavium]|uniref:DegV family protein n=1 Tax=Candidatus Egerieimonas intestinavium TaxID=2840777 RepID=A0A9D1EKJ2_9FIRM|nr:DegV family protein [Candidatus Egerieimonas intestinavium]
MRVAIMTDTNSGIMGREAEELGIFSIPMPVIIEEETFFEGKNITEEEFYRALGEGKRASTSLPSPKTVLDTWDFVLSQGYEEIVYIPMSSGLSNSCGAAAGMALDYEGKVFVVDNHRISITLREAVLKAKRLADAGSSGSQIKRQLEKEAYDASIYIAVDTLEYLKKGGRITPAAAMIGTVLHMKPILTIQGDKLDAYAKVRGMKKCQSCMLEAVSQDFERRFAGKEHPQMIAGVAGTCLPQDKVEEWKQALREVFPLAQEVYYNALPISIGCHVGPGAVGIGFCFR